MTINSWLAEIDNVSNLEKGIMLRFSGPPTREYVQKALYGLDDAHACVQVCIEKLSGDMRDNGDVLVYLPKPHMGDLRSIHDILGSDSLALFATDKLHIPFKDYIYCEDYMTCSKLLGIPDYDYLFNECATLDGEKDLHVDSWLALADRVGLGHEGITLELCYPPKEKFVQRTLRMIDAAGMHMEVGITTDDDSYFAHDNGHVSWGDTYVYIPDPDITSLHAIYKELGFHTLACCAEEGNELPNLLHAIHCDSYTAYIALINSPEYNALIDAHRLTEEEEKAKRAELIEEYAQLQEDFVGRI